MAAGNESCGPSGRDMATLQRRPRGGRMLSFDVIDRALRAPVYTRWSEPDGDGGSTRGAWPAIVRRTT